MQRHTVNILSLYPWLCFRDLSLDILFSLLNHKSFCKALERLKENMTLFRAKPDSFPCYHSVHMITSGASSAGISDECQPCRKCCLLPAIRQMGPMVAQACSALLHSSAKWWELQTQHWAEHCTVLHSPSFCCTSCHHHLFLFQFGWKE